MFAVSLVKGDLRELQEINVKVKILGQLLGVASAIVGVIYKLFF